MKKTALSLLAATFLLNTAVAQLSQGGLPRSFDKHFAAQPVTFVNMPSFDLADLQAQDAINDHSPTKGPFRFGFNHLVSLSMVNSGTWSTMANGDRMWQLGIKSKGAKSINLAMDDFFMPEGAKLFIYNADKSVVIGAFTSVNNDISNHFATDLINGESIILEYYEPIAVSGQGRMNIFRVTHGYRGGEDYYKSFGDAGSCQTNINCPLGTNWQNEKRGIVCLVVGGSEFCSGSLVNDVPQDGKPYVLTANHCSSSNDFASWVFRFHWEAAGCTSPGSSPTSQSLNTSTLRARSAGSDFCLVEITGGLSGGTVPASYNPYFNGWSNSPTAATSTMCLHHPSGDIMKISESATTAVSSTMSGAQCWNAAWTAAACTEPGSSGSALFDQNHRIVGQLFGGPSACGAAAASMNDNYGKFTTSWLGGGTSATQLKVWLDAGNTGAVTVDGYDPNAVPPAFTRDAAIQSITDPATGYSSCSNSVVPKVVLRNYGSATLTSCTVNYKVDGGAVQTYAWTGSLNTNATTTVTLPTITGLSVAPHTFKSYTSNPNAGLEENPVNDTSSSAFDIISASPVVSAPQFEGFQSTFPSTNWTVVNPDANDTWLKVTTAGGFGASTSSASIDFFTNDLTGQSDYIYSPYLDLSAAVAPITLTFDVAYARYNATYTDSLIVKTTTNCGSSWARVYAKGNTALATAPDATSAFTPTSTQWRTETVNLNTYAGQSAVRVAFEGKSGYGQFLFIDNINIVSGSTGINEAELAGAFNVYPNPNNGVFNVSINLVKAGSVTVKVVNVLGETISSKVLDNVSNNTFSMDLSSQSKGLYFVEISSGDQKVVKKINIIK